MLKIHKLLTTILVNLIGFINANKLEEFRLKFEPNS